MTFVSAKWVSSTSLVAGTYVYVSSKAVAFVSVGEGNRCLSMICHLYLGHYFPIILNLALHILSCCMDIINKQLISNIYGQSISSSCSTSDSARCVEVLSHQLLARTGRGYSPCFEIWIFYFTGPHTSHCCIFFSFTRSNCPVQFSGPHYKKDQKTKKIKLTIRFFKNPEMNMAFPRISKNLVNHINFFFYRIFLKIWYACMHFYWTFQNI